MQTTWYRIEAEIQSPCKIALITDVHDRPVPGLIDHLKENKPDLIAVAGDIVRGAELEKEQFSAKRTESLLCRFPYALELMEALPKIAQTYVSLGNHEWFFGGKEIEEIEKRGAVVLDNRWESFREDILIGGLSAADVTNYRRFMKGYRTEHPGDERGNLKKEYYRSGIYEARKRPDTAWLDGFEKAKGYRILLSHHPEYWPQGAAALGDRALNLVLSGHAHGGQIRLFGRGLYAGGQGILPKYSEGVFRTEHSTLVVSRGLANTTWIPRLFNPTEIVYVEPEPARADEG